MELMDRHFGADNWSSLLSGPTRISPQHAISGTFLVSFFVIKPERCVEKIFVLAIQNGLVFLSLGLRATRGLLF